MTDPPELLPVPTIQDLVRRGLATAITRNKDGGTTLAHITPAGHDLMGAALIENGRRLREHDQSSKVSRETFTKPTPDILPPEDPWFDIGSHSIDK